VFATLFTEKRVDTPAAVEPDLDAGRFDLPQERDEVTRCHRPPWPAILIDRPLRQ